MPPPVPDPENNDCANSAGLGPSHQQPRVYTTEQLFGGLREIWIQHANEQYRLRITSSGKLLLTK